MQRLYLFESILGTFYICRLDSLYLSLLGGEVLGTYGTPEIAAAEAAGVDQHRLAAGWRESAEANAVPFNLNGWQKLY